MTFNDLEGQKYIAYVASGKGGKSYIAPGLDLMGLSNYSYYNYSINVDDLMSLTSLLHGAPHLWSTAITFDKSQRGYLELETNKVCDHRAQHLLIHKDAICYGERP